MCPDADGPVISDSWNGGAKNGVGDAAVSCELKAAFATLRSSDFFQLQIRIQRSMATGKVKFFDETKGWGFVARDDGNGDVFLHINQLKKSGVEGVSPDDKLSFDVEKHPKGDRATNIARV